MKIATLSIGDELVLGEIVDTNARHLAGAVFFLGLRVHEHRIIGDNEQEITEAVLELAEKHDVVIATGGLGPTLDDVTVQAVAKATGQELVLFAGALRHMELFAAKGAATVIEGNRKQAFFPAQANLIPNKIGTACGFSVTHKGSLLFFLPGVPKEMEPMVEQSVLPVLRKGLSGQKLVATRKLKIFGISEVEVNRLLEPLHLPGEGVSLAMCARFPIIEVILRGEGAEEATVQGKLAQAVHQAKTKLGEYLFTEEKHSMQEVVARLFLEKRQTLSLAESCTGGEIARLITEVPGSSAFFLECAVTYSNAAKVRALGVPATLIEDHGAVSSQVAMAMAEGIRGAANSDVAVSVTGIAGPDGGSAEKPVGTVHIALAAKTGTTAKMFHFLGDRDQIRLMASFTVLDWLRRYLLSLH